jgi:hypothetical protein
MMLTIGLALAVAATFLLRMAWANDTGWRNFVGWPLGIASALGSVACFAAIFVATGIARCPQCGVTIGTLDPSGDTEPAVACEKCGGLFAVENRSLRSVGEDEVLAKPCLTAPLAETLAWPEGCVLCGAPATRNVGVEATSSGLMKNLFGSALGLGMAGVVGVGFVSTGRGARISVGVPHCDAHADGVGLAFGTLSGTPRIRFRAVRPFRAFCALNGVKAIRQDG